MIRPRFPFIFICGIWFFSFSLELVFLYLMKDSTFFATSFGITSIEDNSPISIHIGKYVPLFLSESVNSSPCPVPKTPLTISAKKKYWVPLNATSAIHSLKLTSTPNSSNASLLAPSSGVSPSSNPPLEKHNKQSLLSFF